MKTSAQGTQKVPALKKKARPLSRTLEGMRKLGRATKIGGGKGLVPATRPSEKESYLDKGSVQSRVEHPGRPVFLEIGITIPALDEAEASGLDGNQVTQCGLGIIPDRVVQEGDRASPTECQRVAAVVLQALVKFEPGDGHVLRVIHGDREGSTGLLLRW